MKRKLSEKRASNLLSPHIPWSPEGLSSHLSPHHPIKNITTSGLLSPLHRMKKLMALIGILYISFFIGFANAQQTAIDSSDISDSLQMQGMSKTPHWDRDLKFSSQIDKTTLPQNDTLTFKATIELKGNPLEYKFDEIDAPKVSNLSLISSSSRNKTEVIDGENNYYRIYTFEYIPKTMGMAYINPAILNLEHNPSGQAKKLRTSRLEVDVKEPVLPKDYSKITKITLIVLGIIIIFIVIYFFIIKMKKQEVEIEDEAIPLETEYLSKLRETRGFLQRGDLQAFFSSTPQIMRAYLARKFGIQAKGMSTKELIAELESAGMAGRNLDELSKSFEICDRVRFAREDVGENAAQQVFAGFEKILESFEPKEDENFEE
ncbi:MAG: BatD family protein [Candidatus Zixiibacteriota bacterium]